MDANRIIHCAYGYNGIHIDNHDWLAKINGWPHLTVFRYEGAPISPKTVRFEKPFIMEEQAFVNGIHQARLAGIVERNFDWTDNGIPTALIAKLDQYEGEIYQINGEWQVLQEYTDDLGFKYLKLNLGEFGEVWVWERALNNPIELKQKQVAEVLKAEAPKAPESVETPVDNSTSNNPADTNKIAENSPKIDEKTEVEVQKEEKNDMSQNMEASEAWREAENLDELKQIIDNLVKKEEKMAYSKEDVAELKIATQRIEEQVAEIHDREEVEKITGRFSPKTKMIVYIIGDLLIGLGLLVPSLAVVLEWGDLVRTQALAGVLAQAGGFLLVMFGILKGKK